MLSRITHFIRSASRCVWHVLDPYPARGESVGAVADTVRSRRDLIVENAVLRHQIDTLRRSAGRHRGRARGTGVSQEQCSRCTSRRQPRSVLRGMHQSQAGLPEERKPP